MTEKTSEKRCQRVRNKRRDRERIKELELEVAELKGKNVELAHKAREAREAEIALRLYPGQAVVELKAEKRRSENFRLALCAAEEKLDKVPKSLMKAKARMKRQDQRINDLRHEVKYLKVRNGELSKIVQGVQRVLCADCGI